MKRLNLKEEFSMKKALQVLVFCMLTLGLVIPAWSATYYMRADGTAANKAAATGPASDKTKCMSITTHNKQTFSPGDRIYLSSQGGIIRLVDCSFQWQ